MNTEYRTLPQGKKTVLIIDDDPVLRDALSMVLEEYEFEVFEAENGMQGCAIAFEEIPSLIICDVRMNEMHGYATVQLIRENPRTEHIPVILMTGYASMMGQRRGEQAGADFYLAKPFRASELAYLLQKVEVREQNISDSPDVILDIRPR